MYVKFTRLDGTPIWINAAFVVTVEPRKLGGSTVVPIGDGLDYDVRETPEQALDMLAGAPTAAVVPVPPPKGLAPTPEDVSPEPEDVREPAPAPEPDAEPPHKAIRARTRKTATGDGEAKPARKPRARTTKKTAEAPSEKGVSESSADASPAVPVAEVVPSSEVPFADEQVERLRRMAPRSLKKLSNTLVSQFRVKSPEQVVEYLAARGVLFVEQGHVSWR